MHPEVQKRAQKELDDVVGPERVPSFDDIDRLPYIQAIVLEVTRWHTVLPYGSWCKFIRDLLNSHCCST
jgi:cytochrome P450